jgi:iron complex outermembrane receptor protein
VQLKVGHTQNESRYRAMYMYNYGFAATPFADVYFKKDVRKIKSSDAELTFGGDFELFGRDNTFLLSAEYRNIKQNVIDYAFDNIGTVNGLAPDFTGLIDNARPIVNLDNGGVDQHEKRSALAAQVLLRPFDKWSVLLGARFDKIDVEARRLRFDPDPTDSVIVSEFDVSTDRSDSHITPRLGVVYEVSPQLNAFVSYTQGFIPQQGIKRDLSDIDPEEGDQYELGLKGEFFGKRLGLSLTGFYIERSNVAVADPNNGPGDSFRIEGRAQEHKGVELEIIGQPLDHLNVVLTYAYLDALITRDESGALAGSAAVGAQGNRLTGSPRNSGSFFVQYELCGGALKGLSFGVGAHYVGERANQEADLVAGGFEQFFLRSYTTTDANVRYFGWQDIVLGLEVSNLLDEDYFEVGSDCCGGNYLQRGVSREARVSISRKF